MKNRGLIVAVDGGNSKTDVALLTDDGAVLALVRGRGSSPHELGLPRSMQVVDGLVTRAWRAAGLGDRDGGRAQVAALFMAGADLPDEENALRDAVTAQGWATSNHVANDVFAVLWAATGSGVGVAVTVGAGLNCVGRGADGRTAWFPALGAISGDWGGGPDIGLAALGAGVRAEDGRGRPTTLAGAVASHFGLRTALDVTIAIHQGHLRASRLIELPPLVVLEAERGDAAARAILDRQADEVVALALAALRQLGADGTPIDVVLGGSILAASRAIIFKRISDSIHVDAPAARVMVCDVRPVVGAAVAGLRLAGAGDAAILQARAGLGDGEGLTEL